MPFAGGMVLYIGTSPNSQKSIRTNKFSKIAGHKINNKMLHFDTLAINNLKMKL